MTHSSPKKGESTWQILNDRVQIGKAVNATVLSLDHVPQGYEDFDKGASKKFVLKLHGLVPQAA